MNDSATARIRQVLRDHARLAVPVDALADDADLDTPEDLASFS